MSRALWENEKMSEYLADLVESVRSLAGTMLRSEIAKRYVSEKVPFATLPGGIISSWPASIARGLSRIFEAEK